MKKLSADEFNTLTKNAKVLADDEHGKKVLELPDQTVIKLFRVKRLISQATIYSPARRFANNAKRLHALKIPTITVIDLYKIKSIKRTAVHYQQLKGLTVRDYLKQNPVEDEFLAQLGQFIAHLHSKGIFFRSAHFGNIVYTPDKQFGLIDISDMNISRFSLSMFKRLRNLKHIFRIHEDIDFIKHSQAIEKSYLSHCQINNHWFKKQVLKSSHMLKIKNS